MKRFFIGLCLIISLFGCSKQEEDPLIKSFNEAKKYETGLVAKAIKLGPDVLTRLDIQKVFAQNNVKLTIGKLFDEFYIPVSSKFVFNNISSEVFNFLIKHGQPYKSIQNDCDDFSLAAMVIARKEYFNKFLDNRPVSILFGEFHYITNTGGPHAINCFITGDKNQLTLGFFEPQNGQIINLTQEEIASCTFWRF